MKLFLRWLYPGLKIKRWMLLFSAGLILLVCGATMIWNYQIFGALEEEILRLAYQATGSYSYTFLAVVGTMLILLGVYMMAVSVRRLAKRFIGIVAPEETEVSKQLLAKVELARGPHMVAIGGGHGLSMLLRGLKKRTSNLTAIVTVADDGGSSGRLREEMDIIAPGDLRNCLVALADKDTLLEQLFQYRFGGNGELSGHSLGNLFLAALMKEFGNPQNALEAASKILNIRGQVVPSTSEKIKLSARMSDGHMVKGESEISQYPGRISRLSTIPKNPIAVGDALEAIRHADLITLGPGSLYTSVLPNLLVPEILEAIRESGAPCLYICNVMTQPGETDGYAVSDHLKALIDHIGGGAIDFVLANTGKPSQEALQKYEKVKSKPVPIDADKIKSLGVTLIEADLLGVERKPVHDARALSDELVRIYNLLRANIAPEALNDFLKGSH
ncbi:MAG: YvcK family protein [Dialister sp.]|nr:YvcK family protein [Dialister sp.]